MFYSLVKPSPPHNLSVSNSEELSSILTLTWINSGFSSSLRLKSDIQYRTKDSSTWIQVNWKLLFILIGFCFVLTLMKSLNSFLSVLSFWLCETFLLTDMLIEPHSDFKEVMQGLRKSITNRNESTQCRLI